MKKILSLLLAMLMVIGMFPMTALAIENPLNPGVEFIITANGEEIEAVYDGEEYSNIAYMEVPKYVATLPADSDSFTVSSESGFGLFSLADKSPICMGEPSCTVEVSGNNSYMVGCLTTGFVFHLYIEISGANRRVTLSSGTGYTAIGEKEIANGEDYSFSVELMENYQAGENFAVKVNGEIIGTEPGNYTIENVTENIDIKVVGVEPIKAEEVTVYFSVEEGDHFVEQGGKIWALEEVTVPYFDLANYGMEYLYFNPDCYSEGGNYAPQFPGTKETAENNVTMLHMLIWLTEIYWHEIDEDDAGKGFLANEGNWEGFKIKGSPIAGSAFFDMWNFSYNFNYYVNYEYPLGAPGWGSSCDQIRLFDGDVVTIRYNDNSGKVGTYHHFGEEGLVSKTVKKGENETFELELFRTGEDSSKYTTPIFNAGEGHNVYLMAEDNMDVSPKEGTLMGTTDAEGKVTIDTKDVKPGIYYLVSDSMSPAVMLLEVICEHDWKDATCKEPKTCSVCGETEGKELGHSFGEWETVKEPSYFETGLKERECGVCGEKEEEVLPKKNRPSFGNKPNPGVTDIIPDKGEEEKNPNTGAPVFDLTAAGIIVLAATAAVLEIKRRK